MTGIIASNESTTYTPVELLAGEQDVITNEFTVLTTQTIAANTVVALNTADKIVPWNAGAGDVTNVAIGVTVEAIDTTGGDQIHPIYVGGFFNTDALTWPNTPSATQKLNAFKGTNINHRSLL